MFIFNLLHVFLDSILFDIVHTPGDYIKAFMAFSHPGGWFMNVYFCLVLFSPLLNLAFKQMDQKFGCINLNMPFCYKCLSWLFFA